jgi:thioredoxin reductase (NADPH)
MKLDNKYDILIIGGGPIGLACGIEAIKAGLSYIILEKGCLVNSLYNYPANMTFFSTSDKLEIGNVPFVSNNIKPTRSEALEYYRRVNEHFNLNLRLFEEVKTIMKEGSTYRIESRKSQYKAANIIISTGFYDIPNLLNIPGEDLPKVRHYYKDPHYYAKQHVIVVGANNSSVDAALETYRKGAQVSMVIRESGIGERVKYWVRPDIVNRIKEGSIKAYFNSTLTEVRENEVDLIGLDGKITIQNDFVLAMTGYQPDLSFLKKSGINVSDMKGIYLAGVICGGLNTHAWFIENSRVHATRIVQNIVQN